MRRHRKQLLWSSLVACGGLVACNAITGLSDDYRLGQLDSVDGSVPPGPDGDTPADSSTNDATKTDGGTDSGRVYDGSFCEAAFKEANVIACSDFESDDPLAWKSSAVQITKSIGMVGGTPAGAIEVKDNAGQDGSRALVFTLAALGAQRELFVGYENGDDARSFTGFELTADVLVETETNKAVEYAEVFQLTFPLSNDTSIVNGYGGASYGGRYGTVAPPAGTGVTLVSGSGWKALKTTVTGSSSSGFSGKFFVNAQDVSYGTPTVNVRQGAFARALLGIYHTSAEPYGMTVTFDNIVLRRTGP